MIQAFLVGLDQDRCLFLLGSNNLCRGIIKQWQRVVMVSIEYMRETNKETALRVPLQNIPYFLDSGNKRRRTMQDVRRIFFKKNVACMEKGQLLAEINKMIPFFFSVFLLNAIYGGRPSKRSFAC
jgi:hypothetical protein